MENIGWLYLETQSRKYTSKTFFVVAPPSSMSCQQINLHVLNYRHHSKFMMHFHVVGFQICIFTSTKNPLLFDLCS